MDQEFLRGEILKFQKTHGCSATEAAYAVLERLKIVCLYCGGPKMPTQHRCGDCNRKAPKWTTDRQEFIAVMRLLYGHSQT